MSDAIELSPDELAVLRSALVRQGGPATTRLAEEVEAALGRQTNLLKVEAPAADR